jgi:hypothetical protein
VLLLALVLASAASGLVTGASGARALVSTQMTAYVGVGDLIFGMTFADGTEVGQQNMPGPVIPPGTYQIAVDDSTPAANFDLSGNGVSFLTGVEQMVQTTWTVTFEPCSLYSYQNDQQPSAAYWFQTSASPSSSAACPPSAFAEGTTTAPTATTPIKTVSASPLPPGTTLSALGTLIHVSPARGTLLGAVSASGAVTLTRAGKPVSRLPEGQYTIVTEDRSARAGLIIQKANGQPETLSGAAFVGSRRTALRLTTGSWSFYSEAAHTAAHRFSVVS